MTGQRHYREVPIEWVKRKLQAQHTGGNGQGLTVTAQQMFPKSYDLNAILRGTLRVLEGWPPVHGMLAETYGARLAALPSTRVDCHVYWAMAAELQG